MKKESSQGRSRYWVVQQHDQFQVVQQDEIPDIKPVKGERMKRAHGPYPTREAAQRRADDLEATTLVGLTRGAQ